MVHSRELNGNADAKLNDLGPLADHELDRVSGGVSDLPDNLMTILQQEHPSGIGLPHIGCPRF